MLANTTLAEQTPPEDAHALAAAMWQRFAAWEWSKRAVTLRASDHDLQVPSDAFMFIPCPSEPSANSARNVTRATLALLQSELQFAASGFGFGAQPAAPELLAIFPLFVCCEVRADAAPEHEPLCSAWLEARLLVLVRKLDDVAARPLRMSPSCWLIGVAGDAAQHGTATLVRSASEFSTVTGETAVEVPAVVNEACQDFRRLVGRGEWQGRIEVTVLDAADARRRVPGAEGEDAAAAGAGR